MSSRVIERPATHQSSQVIGVRELKAHASAIIERASRGVASVVTKRGTPVAIVLPFAVDLEALLTEQGKQFVARYRGALQGQGTGDAAGALERMSAYVSEAPSASGARALAMPATAGTSASAVRATASKTRRRSKP